MNQPDAASDDERTGLGSRTIREAELPAADVQAMFTAIICGDTAWAAG